MMDIKASPSGHTRLLLPEYGRNVQKMVRFLRTIEDRTLRNRQAEVVVGIMGNLYPHKRDTQEYRNMLWDHLFMIADFDLDIDSPYPRPTADQFSPIPQVVPYPKGDVAQKQYGRYSYQMVQMVANTADQSAQDKEMVSLNLAKFMRQKSYDYNNEYPDNQVVLSDITRMSKGAIQLAPTSLDTTQPQQNRSPQQSSIANRRRNRRKTK